MERDSNKEKLYKAWNYLNYITLTLAIGFGGSAGLILAAVDVGQIIYVNKKIKERRGGK